MEAEVKNENTTIFVGNIPRTVNWKDLETFFSKFGSVSNVKCLQHILTKRNRGAAFIKFDCTKAVDKVKDAQEEELTLQGRVLRIGDYTRTKSRGSKRRFEISDLPDGGNKQYRSTQIDDGRPSLQVLNDDCLTLVLSFMEPMERVRLQRVNKTWTRCALLASKNQKHLALHKPSNKPFAMYSKVQISRLIKNCSDNLVSLDLSWVSQQIDKVAVETIASCCQTLSWLDISGAISVSNRGMTMIAKSCPNLKWLKMDDCFRISEKGIWSVLHHCKQLEFFQCCRNRFTGKCFGIATSSITDLILRHCQALSNEGVFKISQKCAKLKRLDLHNCQLIEASHVVGEVLKKCKLLEDVDVGHFCADLPTKDEALESDPHVVRCLAQPLNITRLMLDNSGLADSDLHYVCTHLLNVIELDISCNYLTDVSVTQLSALPKLKILHICHLFNISNLPMIDLVQQGRLENLRMQGCRQIGDELFEEMATHCKSLEELDIAGVRNATTRTLAAFRLAVQSGCRVKDRLYIYAFDNKFLEAGEKLCPYGMSLCVIYRRLYPSHNQWVLESDGEPHDIVINHPWPEEYMDDSDSEDSMDQEQEVSVTTIPADLDDGGGSCSEPDEFGEEFLINDDPLELEEFEYS